MKKKAGFTLVELMVVILIIGILAAVSIPMVQANVDRAIWSEAHAMAGAIRRAEQLYFLETGKTVKGNLKNSKKYQALGLQPEDLSGTYFNIDNFRIMSVNEEGIPTVRVRANKKLSGINGQKTLYPNGDWK